MIQSNYARLPAVFEAESKQPIFSEKELIELYNNPNLLKEAIGANAYDAMLVQDSEFPNKLIVSNYLSQTQQIDSNQILNNYEAYSQSIGLSGNASNDANDIIFDITKARELAEKEITPVTFTEGVSGAAKRGKGNINQMYSLMGINDPIYQNLIDGKIRNIKDSEKLLASEDPFVTEGMKDFERFRLEKDRQFIASTILLKSNEIKNFIEAQSQIESANLSQGYQKFIDSGKIPTSPKAFGEFLTGFMVEQTFQQIPMTLKTAMSGPAAPFTVFGDSLNTERVFEMMQHLKENGVDFNSQESLNSALSNEKLMSDASARGLRKGIPIAITSALSAYLPIKGKTALGKLGREVVTQAGLDSVGEVLGQYFATGEVDMQEVMLEVLGGTTQSVAEFSTKIAANVAKSPINSILKNEDGSIKSRKEVGALSEYLPNDFAEEMTEADPLTGNLIVEAIKGNSESYDGLVSIIRANEETKVEVSPELKKLSDAVNEFESARVEIETSLDVVDETVGVELEGEKVKGIEQSIEKVDYIKGAAQATIFTDSQTGGKLKIIEHKDPKKFPSVIDLYVPEENRRKGSARRLMNAALKKFGKIQGQVSNEGALRLAYDNGRRPASNLSATFEESLSMLREDSSVNMVSVRPPSKEMPIRPGDPRDAGIKSGIEEAPSTREERLRQSKNTAIIELKSQIKRIKNRHKERAKKFEEKIKELKADKRESAKAERDMLLDFGTKIEQLWKALPDSIKGRTNPVSAILSPATLEGRLSALDKFEERINKAIEKDFRQTREKTLKYILKKATKGDAKAVSKRLGLSAEIVEKISQITKASNEDNQAAMYEELSKLPEGSKEGQLTSTLYSAFSDLKNKNSKQLNEAIVLAEEIIKYGKDWSKQFEEKKAKEDRKLRGDLLEEVGVIDPTKEEKPLPEAETKLKEKGKRKPDVLMSKEELANKQDLAGVFKEWLNGADWYLSAHDGIEQLIENLIRVPGKQYAGKLHDQITKPAFKAAESFLTKQRTTRESAFDAFNKVLKDKGLGQKQIKDLFMSLRKAPNFKKGDTTGIYFESEPGYGVKEQPISPDQAIQLWMWRQDKTLQGSFDTMKWTDEVDAQLESYIGKEGIALAEYMLSVYKKLGVEMNDVLFKVEGWKLPIVENYSPVSKKTKNALLDIEETMKDGIVNETAKNNSMKLRVDKKAPLDATHGALAVFDRHISEMNHWITHGEIASRINNLFKNERVKRAITQIYGPQRVRLIMHMIENFTRGGIDRSRVDPFVSKLIRNIAVGKLALNFPSAIKQLGSIPAYANAMPAAEWSAGFLSFLKNPSSSIKILLETDYIKNRITTTGDRDLRAIAESNSFQQAAAGAKNWRDRFMILTRLGDVGAIMAGGWPVYKKAYDDAIAAGKSISEAKEIAEFEFGFVSDRSQQSSKIQNLSYFQSAGSFAKLFTMFMTSPIQYMRITTSAARAAFKGRITKREAIKTFAIYHVILPSIFTAMGSMGLGIFSDDEEKYEAWKRRQWHALLLGNLNSLFLIGEAVDAVLGSFIKEEDFYDLSNPVISEIENIVRSAANIDEEGNLTDLVGSMALLMGGIPYDTISREFEAKYELLQGDDVWQNLWGISDWAAFETKKKKKSTNKRSSLYDQ